MYINIKTTTMLHVLLVCVPELYKNDLSQTHSVLNNLFSDVIQGYYIYICMYNPLLSFFFFILIKLRCKLQVPRCAF